MFDRELALIPGAVNLIMEQPKHSSPESVTAAVSERTQRPSAPRRNIVLQAESAVFNVTCYGFHVWAEDFLAAEKMYAPTARTGSFVAHFLCCQSVELSLKGFLSLKGLKRMELRKRFGHNLVRLYREASALGLGSLVTVQPDDLNILIKVNNWYDTAGGKKFQYFDAWEAAHAFKNAPDLAGIEALANRLQSQALRDAVLKG